MQRSPIATKVYVLVIRHVTGGLGPVKAPSQQIIWLAEAHLYPQIKAVQAIDLFNQKRWQSVKQLVGVHRC